MLRILHASHIVCFTEHIEVLTLCGTAAKEEQLMALPFQYERSLFYPEIRQSHV